MQGETVAIVAMSILLLHPPENGWTDLFLNHRRRKFGDWKHTRGHASALPQHRHLDGASLRRSNGSVRFWKGVEGLSSHGPYDGFVDLDRDRKPDLLAYPEMGTYFFYRRRF